SAGVHYVALREEPEADAPGDRRVDSGVAELHLRVVDGALVALDLRLLLLDERALRVDLLLGDGERTNCRIADEVALAVGEQRFIERLLGERLIERGLKRAR